MAIAIQLGVNTMMPVEKGGTMVGGNGSTPERRQSTVDTVRRWLKTAVKSDWSFVVLALLVGPVRTKLLPAAI